jgi:DinB superfamily
MPPTARVDLLRRLAEAPERVARVAHSSKATPAEPDEWTSQEVVLHLVAVERVVFQARLRDLAEQGLPAWAWVEPGPEPASPGETLSLSIARFQEARSETLAWVGTLDDEGWRRAGQHATLGRLDVAGLLALAASHDDEHLAALDRIGERS